MTRNRRRLVANAIAKGAVYATAAIALFPLSLVLIYTVVRGLPAFQSLQFFTNSYRPVGIPGAGIAYALVGTIIMVGIASLMAIPVGVISGVQLAEYSGGQLARWVRLSCDVLVATPSIILGLFVYALLVAPVKHYSALAGSVALAILMLPVVVRTTETAVALVPHRLREAGLALGLARWRVALRLMLPAAAPGVITGALLAVARAAGETAPLLFTTGFTLRTNFNLNGFMNALPLQIYNDVTSPTTSVEQRAWGAALTLVSIILLLNVLARLIARRSRLG